MERYTYLLRIQFLGFRYHGWQFQPDHRTVEGMLRKTFRFVLPGSRIKLLGAGRTDAMVSADDFALQLLTEGELPMAIDSFVELLNRNLPPDIRVSSMVEVPARFNAIRDSLGKTYRYYFCFGPKPHPFSAPFLGYFPGPLDLEAMAAAAAVFVGNHNFQAFTAHPSAAGQHIRTLEECSLERNEHFKASFFPDPTYLLQVRGRGFGRYQVRLMMAALVDIGRGEAQVDLLRETLSTGGSWEQGSIAPASGLQLVATELAVDDQ